MKQWLFLFLFIFECASSYSQQAFRCVVKDSITKEVIPGAIVLLEGTANGASSDTKGLVVLKNIPTGAQKFSISCLSYNKKIIQITFPMNDTLERIIFLSPAKDELEEVIVSTTRTNGRIEDLPIKVEVLGEDDMDEESTIVPGGIGSILGDLSVITIQRTNPVNGNDAVRMQGLDYKYTQLLRDGLPLYEGFSGSLGVLAIPPLDLKQVEIIKGSASTLYGGGAIGGLINFISKTPTDSAKAILTLNQTSLKETNVNTFMSKKYKRIGTTLFAGGNLKQAYDVNNDGYAEVPEQRQLIFHPRVFFYLTPKANADIGLTLTSDNRKGGSMNAIHHTEDTINSFLFTERVLRTTVDGHFTYQAGTHNFLTVKSTLSNFDRTLYYGGFNFTGKQISSYSEFNDLFTKGKHTWVNGVNFVAEQFSKVGGDAVQFGNYVYQTTGFFSQEDYQLTPKISLEGGIRADYHNRYNWFILPRAGIFVKASPNLSLRLHYGSGYKIPNLFSSSQPYDYARLMSIRDEVKPELSNGFNMDLNYHTLLWNQLSLQLNQAFYSTNIKNPTILHADSSGNKFIINAPYSITSIGTDTYIRLKLRAWELYLGYNHTEAKQLGTGINFNMPFNPKDKFATTLAYEIAGTWRMGIEAAYSANQYIYNNERVPNFWFLAGMLERKFPHGSVVLNCENMLDYRQSIHEPLVTGSSKQPVFASIWGPVEGRVINLSLKFTL
ncbi:MAG: TonB-dependent receptor [bacterium]|nr:TonB-dependent receptor [bacterium]